MARPRTPSLTLVARGALKKNPNRARPDEPEGAGEVGPPPAHFNSTQIVAWNDIVSRCHAGVLCHADGLALEIAAVLFAEFRSNPIDMPAAKLARLDSLLGRFGMTPADRSKVSSPGKKSNKFTQLLTGK